jgi:hypothetical protein
MFSCTKYSLIHAVKKGHLSLSPGLTQDAINKYLKMTSATAMGHMNQKRQNILSTDKNVKTESEDEDIAPSATSDNVNTSGKAGAQIPHLPLGDDSPPWGR